MTRTELDAGVTRYRVRRVDWAAIGWKLGGRLAAAVLGAEALTIAIGQGWI